MNTDALCAKLDGLDIGPREEPPAYSRSYDLIIPLVRKLTKDNPTIQSKFLFEVMYGGNTVRNWKAVFQATPAEWANAIIRASGL